MGIYQGAQAERRALAVLAVESALINGQRPEFFLESCFSRNCRKTKVNIQ